MGRASWKGQPLFCLGQSSPEMGSGKSTLNDHRVGGKLNTILTCLLSFPSLGLICYKLGNTSRWCYKTNPKQPPFWRWPLRCSTFQRKDLGTYALNKGSNLDNSSLEQEFTAAGAGWGKGKGNAVKGALTPLLGQAAVTCIPVSGQDYSCKSKQLHPLQRGEDTEPFHSLLGLKSSLPCLWHSSHETRDSSLHFVQHQQLQDVSRLPVEIGIEWLRYWK